MLTLKVLLVGLIGIIFPSLGFSELRPTYDGIDVRPFVTVPIETTAAIVATVCCEEESTKSLVPITGDHYVSVRVRMSKNAEVSLWNNTTRTLVRYKCNQPGECTKGFTVATTRNPIHSLSLRYYCEKQAVSSDDPNNAYVGLTVWKGQVSVDGTDKSPISCMPKVKAAETAKSHKKAKGKSAE